VVSRKAHLFPLSVVIPALVAGIIAGADLLGVRWTLLNTVILSLIMLFGIALECIASMKIANLRFSEKVVTKSPGKKNRIDVAALTKR